MSNALMCDLLALFYSVKTQGLADVTVTWTYPIGKDLSAMHILITAERFMEVREGKQWGARITAPIETPLAPYVVRVRVRFVSTEVLRV